MAHKFIALLIVLATVLFLSSTPVALNAESRIKSHGVDILAHGIAQILEKYYGSKDVVIDIVTKSSNPRNQYQQNDLIENVLGQLNGTILFEMSSLDKKLPEYRRYLHDHHLFLIDGYESFE